MLQKIQKSSAAVSTVRQMAEAPSGKDAISRSETGISTCAALMIKAEYPAWHSENITFENCTIIATQPLCCGPGGLNMNIPRAMRKVTVAA